MNRGLLNVVRARRHMCAKSPIMIRSFTDIHFSKEKASSADTEIPYGEAGLASAAYLPDEGSGTRQQMAATAENAKRSLTPRQRQLLEEIVRIDQVGELAANWIYRGQHLVAQRTYPQDTAQLIKVMWDQEKKHIAAMDRIALQHDIRPTALYPLCKAAGFVLGAGSALLGERTAMACTEAVETVIGEHYDEQIGLMRSSGMLDAATQPDSGAQPGTETAPLHLLEKVLAEFRDDELEHLDTAVENDAQKAPAHALFSVIVAAGCRGAISLCQRI